MKRPLLAIIASLVFVTCSGVDNTETHPNLADQDEASTQVQLQSTPAESDSPSIKDLVIQWELGQASALSDESALLDDEEECRPSRPGQKSCVDVACDRLGTFGCNEQSEISRVGDACRGNRNGGCLETACDKLGTFGCNEMSEIEAVGSACRGNFGAGCIKESCDLLGTFGCNELSEINRVGAACKGVRNGCIESVCERLGTFGCNEMSEIEKVALTCSGN